VGEVGEVNEFLPLLFFCGIARASAIIPSYYVLPQISERAGLQDKL
jgi:hypothetical protein